MQCRWRILIRGVQDSLLQAVWAARSFAIGFGAVCERLFAGTSTNYGKAFGL
jgi:demethoxyubiquinone hydroxylase (CLK1/Coq7/Cat5 family)